MYWRSRDADFRDETHRIGHGRVEKALIRGGGGTWFFNARAVARARVCMQSTVGFSEAAVPRLRLGGTDGRYAYIKRAQRIYHS